MKIADIPASKFQIAFAASAGGGFVRAIPQASQIGITNGAASLADGFPPLNFLPVGAGGVPPFGQDMNGILKQITQWSQWQNAGGLVPYDSAFATAIGGYPKGAVLAGTTAGVVWLCTTDDNIANPNPGNVAGWFQLASAPDLQSGKFIYAAAGGSANAITVTLAPLSSIVEGMEIVFKAALTNTTATTINVNGAGAVALQRKDGSACVGGEVQAGQYYRAVKASSTPWRLQQAIPASQVETDAGLLDTVFLTPKTRKNSFRFFDADMTNSFSVPNNVMTNVAIDTPTANTLIDSTTFSTAKITVGAQDAGVWLITAWTTINGGTGVGAKGLRIHINGSPSYLGPSRVAAMQIGLEATANDSYLVAATIAVVAGDIITADILQTTGSSQLVTQGRFRIARIG